MNAVNGGIGLVGNINNPETLYARGPEEVRREVFRCLDAGVQMIAPECAVPLATKIENLMAIPKPSRTGLFPGVRGKKRGVRDGINLTPRSSPLPQNRG